MIATRVRLLAGAGVLLGAMAGGWVVNGWRLGEQMADQRAEHIDQLRRTAAANAQVILQQQAEQQVQARTAAELDAKHYEEMSHAQSENRRLEALYSDADDERRRLRIEVIVARNDVTVSAITGTGSVGAAASLELSGEAGRAIWDIRRMMLEDRAKLTYLQRWTPLAASSTPIEEIIRDND